MKKTSNFTYTCPFSKGYADDEQSAYAYVHGLSRTRLVNVAHCIIFMDIFLGRNYQR